MATDTRGERAEGIRNHTETGVIPDGSECKQSGSKFYKSANDAILTEGANVTLPADLVTKVISIRSGKVLYTRIGGRIVQKSADASGTGRSVTPMMTETRLRLTDRGETPRQFTRTPSSSSPQMSSSHERPSDLNQSFSSSYRSSDRSPYVIETPESRRSLLVNEDPFGGKFPGGRLNWAKEDSMRGRDSYRRLLRNGRILHY